MTECVLMAIFIIIYNRDLVVVVVVVTEKTDQNYSSPDSLKALTN